MVDDIIAELEYTGIASEYPWQLLDHFIDNALWCLLDITYNYQNNLLVLEKVVE